MPLRCNIHRAMGTSKSTPSPTVKEIFASSKFGAQPVVPVVPVPSSEEVAAKALSAKNAVEDGTFIPSSTFTEIKQGYAFRLGVFGQGYYKTPVTIATTAIFAPSPKCNKGHIMEAIQVEMTPNGNNSDFWCDNCQCEHLEQNGHVNFHCRNCGDYDICHSCAIIHTVKGTSTYGNPYTYIGPSIDGKACGQRKRTYENGEVYKGDFKNGNMHGTGTYTQSDGHKYVGEWKDDKQDGSGTSTWPCGKMYVGQWKADAMDGTGTCTYKDGRTYCGGYKADKKDGNGTFTWPSGEVYTGGYQDGKKSGTGTHTWSSGEKFVGGYKNGKKHGFGTHTFPENGKSYTGQFKDGKKDGTGTYTWPDGQMYVGEWKDDMRHGTGKLTKADGSVQCGQWENDRSLPQNNI